MHIAFGSRFIFSRQTTEFNEVQRSSPQRFSSHERLGQRPQLQNLGPGTDTTTLPGAIFACWIGDFASMDELYRLKEAGNPEALWTLRGGIGMPYLPGSWVITDIKDTWKRLDGDGLARKQEWTLSLSRYE